METELILEGIAFPKMSARGCIQDLMPIIYPQLFKRTLNGELIYLGKKEDQKYTSLIKCHDKDVPAFNHLWVGDAVKVHCLQHLYHPFDNGKGTLNKEYVERSIKVFNEKHQKINFKQKDKEITAEADKGYIQFRPILMMHIKNFSFSYNEWGTKVGWSLELEEI